jgi:MFS family permease
MTTATTRHSGALVGFLGGTALFTLANGAFNLLVAPSVAGHGHTEVTIGAIVAVGGLSSLLARIPAGNAFRPERVPALVLAGSALAAVGYGVIPAVSPAPALAALSVLQCAGFAVVTTVGMAALIERRDPRTSAASMMGWYTGSIGTGYALAGFIGGPLADGVGLGGALGAAGVAAFVSGCVTVWALGRLPVRRHDDGGDDRPLRGWIRGMSPGVWLGAAVAVYINVVNGGLNAFLPLHGLAIGLTLTQIGLLAGVHATLASAIRFGAGTLLGRVSPPTVIRVTVVAMACGVALLAAPRGFAPLLLLLALIGLGRGILRVLSGALVMEAAGPSSRHRGRASGIYLAGLDLGNAVGPLVGGFVAAVAGVGATFPVVGLFPAAVFLAAGAFTFRDVRSGRRPDAKVTPEGL